MDESEENEMKERDWGFAGSEEGRRIFSRDLNFEESDVWVC